MSECMYEHRTKPLLTNRVFVQRVAWHVAGALLALSIALAGGVCGYHYLGRLPWIDALLNASMILGGMGPVDPMRTPSGKIFASAYALFSGLFFIGFATILIAPFVHRIFHRFHLEE
ncbi:MAG: hypothetical protein WCR23_06390 [Planctomycetota bacterium]|jgi:hypothetical protein|nr:hypothetical protein [Planctomycetia bacterium]